MKFANGENDYWLSIVPFQQEYYIWAVREKRNVIQQTLNLTLKQRNDLYRFLENNALPQNSVYRYDYFYDNCSNRIDNALKKVFGDSMKFYSEKVVKEHGQSGASIRQLTHQYLKQSKWGELGIETCLGIEMDRKITPEQFKFLPDFLMWNYDKAVIISKEKFSPLVVEKTFLFRYSEKSDNESQLISFSPMVCFSLILILSIVLSFPFASQPFFARFFDFILFFSCGVIGLLLLYLWFFTTHYSQFNLNLIWASPLSFFLSFTIFSRKHNNPISRYYFYYSLLLMLTVLVWALLPQHLNVAYLPLCLALALRSYSNYYFK
ncbi:DUF4105 domain-containing protein [Dyadobacter subterraneus]|uniref:lipoprotein N-acyltransferase Lnb domain-containing protein n=1 Tax=Dyadobacter subterraneus TaxID=2773304 RepID=UPI003609A429